MVSGLYSAKYFPETINMIGLKNVNPETFDVYFANFAEFIQTPELEYETKIGLNNRLSALRYVSGNYMDHPHNVCYLVSVADGNERYFSKNTYGFTANYNVRLKIEGIIGLKLQQTDNSAQNGEVGNSNWFLKTATN